METGSVKCVLVSAKRPETVQLETLQLQTPVQGSMRPDVMFSVNYVMPTWEGATAGPAPFLLPPKHRGQGQGRNLAKRCLSFLANLTPSATVRLPSIVYQW